MSNLELVAKQAPQAQTMAQTCIDLAARDNLARYELAVKARLETGINDDNDLRLADDLLKNVTLGADAIETATRPYISAAHALHKSLISIAGEWKSRWTGMADRLKSAMLAYNKRKAELARRQQLELDAAAEAQRRRLTEEAREALRNGDMNAAKAVFENVRSMVVPIVSQSRPALANSSMRNPWAVEITDKHAFVKAIADGIVPICAIKEFDLGFLKREATTRGGLDWPGVNAWQEEKIAVRR